MEGGLGGVAVGNSPNWQKIPEPAEQASRSVWWVQGSHAAFIAHPDIAASVILSAIETT
jgi:hypothetical protein